MSAALTAPQSFRAIFPSDVKLTEEDGDVHVDLGGKSLDAGRSHLRFEPGTRSLTIDNGSIRSLRIDCGSEKGRELNFNSVSLRDAEITGWGYNLCVNEGEVTGLIAREAESFEIQSGSLVSDTDVEARAIAIACDRMTRCRFVGVFIDIKPSSAERADMRDCVIEGLSEDGALRLSGLAMAASSIVGHAKTGELERVVLEACTVRPVVYHWSETETRHMLGRGKPRPMSWILRTGLRIKRAFAGPHWRPDVASELSLKDVKFHNVIVDMVPLEQVVDLKKVSLKHADLLDKWEVVRDAYSLKRLGIPIALALIYTLPLITYLKSRGDFGPDETWWMVLATGATSDWRLWPIALLGVVIPWYVFAHLSLTGVVWRLRRRSEKLKKLGFMRTRPGRRRFIWIYRTHWPWMVWALVLCVPIGAWKLINALNTIMQIMG